jgi:hypothetical protein
MKYSTDPFGAYFIFRLLMKMPFILPKILVDFVTDKYQIFFSNAHMTKVPLCFNGVKQRQDLGSFYISSAPGKGCCNFTICTMGNAMGIVVFND